MLFYSSLPVCGTTSPPEKTGSAVRHTARWAATKPVAGTPMLLLMPGLNILDAATDEAYADHPPYRDGLKGDEDGDGYRELYGKLLLGQEIEFGLF